MRHSSKTLCTVSSESFCQSSRQHSFAFLALPNNERHLIWTFIKWKKLKIPLMFKHAAHYAEKTQVLLQTSNSFSFTKKWPPSFLSSTTGCQIWHCVSLQNNHDYFSIWSHLETVLTAAAECSMAHSRPLGGWLHM